VLTHAHADHVGIATRLLEHGARVHVQEDDRGLATTAKASGKNERSLFPYLRYPMAWKLLVHLARTGAAKPQRIADVTTFRDGEEPDVPGRPRVMHTPGHTDGSVALHLPDERALIAGDLLCTLNPLREGSVRSRCQGPSTGRRARSSTH
jgi:glyoxylase-like metal-dependent hydrolase (beta-lactamase superfamily II)